LSPHRTSRSSRRYGSTATSWARIPEPPIPILHNNSSSSTTVIFSHDGKKLATTDTVQGMLTVWDVSARSLITNLTQASDGSAVISAGFSPDGQWLARTEHDHRIRLWDAVTFAPRGILTNSFDPN